MQKIVLDTNILVSALIQHGFPYFIVNLLVIEQKVRLCISNELVQEYRDVLNRKRFSKYRDFSKNAKTILSFVETIAERYFPRTKIELIRDKDDNKLLELAAECKADFLITGNINDFTMKKYNKTLIVTPRTYWEKYRPA